MNGSKFLVRYSSRKIHEQKIFDEKDAMNSFKMKLEDSDNSMLIFGPIFFVVISAILWPINYWVRLFESYSHSSVIVPFVIGITVYVSSLVYRKLIIPKFSEKVLLIVGSLGWVLSFSAIVVWILVQMD